MARLSNSTVKERRLATKERYVWEEVYKAAVLELDREKLSERVRAAKAAIDVRLHELQLDHGGTPEERQALSDALATLNVIRREL